MQMLRSKSPRLNDKTYTFHEATKIIEYNTDKIGVRDIPPTHNLNLSNEDGLVKWLNIYGFNWKSETKSIININHLDDFLGNLIFEEDQKNKIIDLETSLFLTINVLIKEGEEFLYDRIKFYYQTDFLWTIQERKGDYFGKIRTYIHENKGMTRKKRADYLLYKLLEAIIDNYEVCYAELNESLGIFQDLDTIKPEPNFVVKIEKAKRDLLILKKSLTNLKEVLVQLDNWPGEDFHGHYFNLLKEQANFVIEDIDFNLQQLESNLNLIFNLQSHKLNEIMKTLTILSVIFIPLTFLAGIYGMNFNDMPGTSSRTGYFILIGVMCLIAGVVAYAFKRRKWF